MTLQELRYIIALDTFGHFGKAAEACFVSQPTLSIALKRLEDELDVCLFERSKHQVSATPTGQQIIQQAKQVLSQAEQIKVLASSGHDPLQGPLRLGAIYTIGPYLFPHLLPQLHQIAPQMPLIIEETYTGVLRQRLVNNELDIIIIALPFSEPDIVVKPLYEEDFVVLMPHDHPLSHEQAIEPEQLKQHDVLLLGEGHCFRDQVLEACPGLQQHLQEYSLLGESTLTSLETLKHMVASGLGLTVLPRSATQTLNKLNPSHQLLTTRPFVGPVPKRQIACAWRASFPRFGAVDAVTHAVTQCQI